MKIPLLKQIISEIQYKSTEDLANKFKYDDEIFIAYNVSEWHWEYDTDIVHAFLYKKKSDKLIRDYYDETLRLVLVREHIKTGIGAGSTHKFQHVIQVGRLNKPSLALIKSTLKAFSHQKSRAASGFKKLWMNPNKNYQEQDLISILKEQ